MLTAPNSNRPCLAKAGRQPCAAPRAQPRSSCAIRPAEQGANPAPQLAGRRRLLSFAPSLLFLPWRGCDQGGFYSTGVTGTPGKDCQVIYQPAAAAEKRFVEKQRAAAAAAAAAVPPQQAPAAMPGLEAGTAAVSEREERKTVLKEQQAYEREAMRAEQQQRTQQLVDSMWQSLE